MDKRSRLLSIVSMQIIKPQKPQKPQGTAKAPAETSAAKRLHDELNPKPQKIQTPKVTPPKPLSIYKLPTPGS